MSSTKTKITESIAVGQEMCLFLAKLLGHQISQLPFDVEMSEIYRAETPDGSELHARSLQFIFYDKEAKNQILIFWLVMSRMNLGPWRVISTNIFDPQNLEIHTFKPEGGSRDFNKGPIRVSLSTLEKLATNAVAETLEKLLPQDIGLENFKSLVLEKVFGSHIGLVKNHDNNKYGYDLVFRNIVGGDIILTFESLYTHPYFKIVRVVYKNFTNHLPDAITFTRRGDDDNWE